MINLILSGGINVLGLSVNPALFAFVITALIFGGLNLIEFKRFD